MIDASSIHTHTHTHAPRWRGGGVRHSSTLSACTRATKTRYRVCVACSGGSGGDAGAGVVVVAGATGGVGQLVTAKLVEKGCAVRALVRDLEKAQKLFEPSTDKCDRLEIVVADARRGSEVDAAFNSGASVRGVIDCTGTTAFPSTRWQGGGGPSDTSVIVSNLVAAAIATSTVKRYVFVSSIGVERRGDFPFSILNLFGALEHKAIGESRVRDSGLQYCILRAARLTDGPYTRYGPLAIHSCMREMIRVCFLVTGTSCECVLLESSHVTLQNGCGSFSDNENLVFACLSPLSSLIR